MDWKKLVERITKRRQAEELLRVTEQLEAESAERRRAENAYNDLAAKTLAWEEERELSAKNSLVDGGNRAEIGRMNAELQGEMERLEEGEAAFSEANEEQRKRVAKRTERLLEMMELVTRLVNDAQAGRSEGRREKIAKIGRVVGDVAMVRDETEESVEGSQRK
jgi:hypothetical protein